MAFSPETYALLKAQGGGGGGGGESSVFPIEQTFSDGVFTLNKTWQEINNAARSGKLCYVYFNADWEEDGATGTSFIIYLVEGISGEEGIYEVVASNSASIVPFRTDTPNGYPTDTNG